MLDSDTHGVTTNQDAPSDDCGKHFGRLFYKIRCHAGIGSKDLALIAGISDGYIRRIEGEEKCIVRQTTAAALLNAINDHRAIRPDLAERFIELAGLDADILHSGKREVADAGKCFALVSELVDRHGAVVVYALLEAAKALEGGRR